MNNIETNDVRESEIRELTAAELDEVTGASFLSGIGKAIGGVISAPFKAVAAVA
jgi:hypothetical protein